MKILMYTTYFPPQYSGAAKQAIALARELRRGGHRVEFVTVRWPGLPARETHDGFPVYRVEAGQGRRLKELRLWWNLLRYVLKRRGDFDILHSHGAYYTNSVVGPLARLVGWKSLVKASLAQNDLQGVGRSFSGRLHRYFLGLVDCAIAISRDLEGEFLDAGLSREKVHYLPNGVDTERFHPLGPREKAELRKRLDLPVGLPIALSIGVFDERKNIGWLMEQWARSGSFGTGALLLAIGPQSREDRDGSFLAGLKALAAQHPETLRLLGHVEEIELYYQAADLFVLPSLGEGMPNVVLEAMASGLPCVATRVSGVTDLVLEGETGYTFPPGDPGAFDQALRLALGESGTSLGRRARALAEERFSLTALAQSYQALYAALAPRGGAARRKSIIESTDHA